jgi:hypothetical protein
MDNVTFIKLKNSNGVEVEHAIIDHGNGEFTSMLKSTYDAQQAEQSTPIVIDEAKTK